MMVECPKCGFSQPKDQFCANCGVDMDNYVPPDKTISEEVRSNRTIHFIVVLLLLLLGGGYFYKDIMKDRGQRNDASSLFESITNQTETAPTIVRDEAPAEPLRAKSLPRAAARPAATEQLAAPSAPEPEAAVAPSRVRFSFALINTTFLDETLQSSNNQAGDVSIYTIQPSGDSSFIDRAKQRDQWADLPGGRSANYEMATPINLNYFYTRPEEQDEVGFSIEITPDTFENGETQWTVKAFANLTAEDGTLFTLSTEDQITSTGNDPVLIFGIIPRASFSEADRSQFAGSPLQAVTQPEFLNEEAEAVLVITPQ